MRLSFHIPQLPKPFYEKLTQIKVQYALTQWQTILLAIETLALMESQESETFNTLVVKLKEKYGAKG